MPTEGLYSCAASTRAGSLVLQNALERHFAGGLYCDLPMGGFYLVRGENLAMLGEIVSIAARVLCIEHAPLACATHACHPCNTWACGLVGVLLLRCACACLPGALGWGVASRSLWLPTKRSGRAMGRVRRWWRKETQPKPSHSQPLRDRRWQLPNYYIGRCISMGWRGSALPQSISLGQFGCSIVP